MRFLAALPLCACFLVPTYVEAKPSQYPVDGFSGDRYVRVAQGGGMGPDVVKAVKKRSGAKPRHPTPHKQPRRRPPPGIIAPLTLAGGFTREVLGGRPDGCPYRFCGCALSIKVFGRPVRDLFLAANWLRFPRVEKAPGMVAARRGHALQLISDAGTDRRGRAVWNVWDPNSGGGRIRIHTRSLAGFAIVNPRGGRA